MSANRLTRDQIIHRALDLADSPRLDEKDRPSGVVLATALTIGWLQDGLDYFHAVFPWQGRVTSAPLAILTGQATYALPANCIRDYKDGIVLASDQGRLRRRGLSHILDRMTQQPSKPQVYTVQGDLLRLWPTPNQDYTATFWFYQQPSALGPTTVPSFPSDLVLVKYVWLRAQEWSGKVPPIAGEQYAEAECKRLKIAGIGDEAEEDTIPVDRSVFPGTGASLDYSGWMGSPTA